VACIAGLALYGAYEAKTGAIPWSMALIGTLVLAVIGYFRYNYWMMVRDERERKKAAKKAGRIPI
jgi:hypothetical protein